MNSIEADTINELVAKYISGEEDHLTGKKVWFTRQMNKLPEDTQSKVWDKLKKKGYEKSPSRKPRIPRELDNGEEAEVRIRWTDEEWDQLADLIWSMRKNDPSAPLLQLLNRAQKQLPEGRRRNINTSKQEPLLTRLTAKDQELLDEAEDNQKLRDKIVSIDQTPDKKTILENLNDEELDLLFKGRVLDLTTPEEIFNHFAIEHLLGGIPVAELAALTVKRTLGSVESGQQEVANLTTMVGQLSQQIKSGNAGSKQATPVAARTKRLPKVSILGMLSDQAQIVYQRLEGQADFNFVDKKRKSAIIPDNQDIIVLWTNFMSHVLHDHAKKAKEKGAILIYHEGGIGKMIEKIEVALKGLK